MSTGALRCTLCSVVGRAALRVTLQLPAEEWTPRREPCVAGLPRALPCRLPAAYLLLTCPSLTLPPQLWHVPAGAVHDGVPLCRVQERGADLPQGLAGEPQFGVLQRGDRDAPPRVPCAATAPLPRCTLSHLVPRPAPLCPPLLQGVRPLGLQKVASPELAEFINTCISPREIRPRARQLLKHQYFDSIRKDKALISSRSDAALAAAGGGGPLSHDGASDYGSVTSGPVSRTASSLNDMVAAAVAAASGHGGGGGGGPLTGPPSASSVGGPPALPLGHPLSRTISAEAHSDKAHSDSASVRSQRSNASELAMAVLENIAEEVETAGAGRAGQGCRVLAFWEAGLHAAALRLHAAGMHLCSTAHTLNLVLTTAKPFPRLPELQAAAPRRQPQPAAPSRRTTARLPRQPSPAPPSPAHPPAATAAAATPPSAASPCGAAGSTATSASSCACASARPQVRRAAGGVSQAGERASVLLPQQKLVQPAARLMDAPAGRPTTGRPFAVPPPLPSTTHLTSSPLAPPPPQAWRAPWSLSLMLRWTQPPVWRLRWWLTWSSRPRTPPSLRPASATSLRACRRCQRCEEEQRGRLRGAAVWLCLCGGAAAACSCHICCHCRCDGCCSPAPACASTLLQINAHASMSLAKAAEVLENSLTTSALEQAHNSNGGVDMAAPGANGSGRAFSSRFSEEAELLSASSRRRRWCQPSLWACAPRVPPPPPLGLCPQQPPSCTAWVQWARSLPPHWQTLVT